LERTKAEAALLQTTPVGKALAHFWRNTDIKYTFGNDKSLLETYGGKEKLAQNTNALMDVVEETLIDGGEMVFATNEELTGTDFAIDEIADMADDIADGGWWYAISYLRATIVAEANRDGEQYIMTLIYRTIFFSLAFLCYRSQMDTVRRRF
jgi:hypothetical protein